MKGFAIDAAAVRGCAGVAALALLTFFQFPGHTWLQQDSQIYVPILEHLRDPSVLRNDILVQHPHVAFTLYDEVAVTLRGVTGLGFREVLMFQQVLTRAVGIWGIVLMAQAMGLGLGTGLDLGMGLGMGLGLNQTWLVAGICSLGASIAGPAVLTMEYEPTPRAFAVPLLVCAMGLAAGNRLWASSVAAGIAFLYHAPTALPFWGLLVLWLLMRRSFVKMAPLAAAIVILLIAARIQGQAGGAQAFFAQLTPLQEQLQRMRAAYVWISMWPRSVIAHHVVLFAVLIAAFMRLRHKIPPALSFFLLGLPLLGLLSMPASWLLLEQWKWTLAPQVQPMRALLFVALTMQFLTAVAGVYTAAARRWAEALIWFALAYLLPLQPLLTVPPVWTRVALAVALGAGAVLALWRAPRMAPALALVAFFVVPVVGGVVNYPRLHTPELAELSAWARSSTPRDAVFVFPDAARAVYPGIFRAEALRAVYVDWKGGGQVNYLKDFGEQWWFRWRQTLGAGFKPPDLDKDLARDPARDPARYAGLGIQYIVVQPRNRLGPAPVFENSAYLAYQVH